MLQLLPPPIVGTIALSLLAVNTVFWVALFIPVIAARLVVASARFRQRCSAVLIAFAWRWVGVNSWIVKTTQNLSWDLERPRRTSTRAVPTWSSATIAPGPTSSSCSTSSGAESPSSSSF